MWSTERVDRLEDVERHESHVDAPAGARSPRRRRAGSTRRPSVAGKGFELVGELFPVMFVFVFAYRTSE